MFLKFSSRFFALALLATSSVQAQDGMDHSMHMNHNMPMGDSLAWRMVPMGDLSMPMMPGMMDDYPEVGPMLPGHGMDISMFSEARPSEIIDMADGDTLHMDASLVRRTIGGQEYVMMVHCS